MDEHLYSIFSMFATSGSATKIEAWGNGLINDTYRVYTDSGEEYLFQRINGKVYTDLDGTIENIYRVTTWLNEKVFYMKNGAEKQKISLIPMKNGELIYKEADGNGWRVYNFMKNTYCVKYADKEKLEEVRQLGVLLGQFHFLLRDYPVETLHVTIPHFYDPMRHYEKLKKLAEDNVNDCQTKLAAELRFLDEMKNQYELISKAYEAGEIPLRVNHNDPKINNIMFDCETNEPLCMVDLDTVMPGLIPYDFGDGVRSIMCTGKDKGAGMKIEEGIFNKEMYDKYLEGFLDGFADQTEPVLTEKEIEYLPLGAKLVALQSAMRYLTDYINGNIYFKVSYPEQNLVKARMHIQLAKEMCEKLL